MSRKRIFLCAFLILLTAMAVVLGKLTAMPAYAQCGDTPADSSCITCHEIEGADPVLGKGEWHDIHAPKDCCWNCHGGNTQTQDKDLAHIGMTVHPLQDIYTGCYCCHPNNYPELAERYGVVLGVTPDAAPTPTAVAVAPVESHPMVIFLPASVETAPSPWLVAMVGVVILGLFIMGLVWLGWLKIKGN